MAIVPSVLVEQTERGDEMFMTMFARHCELALDLDSAATLPVAVLDFDLPTPNELDFATESLEASHRFDQPLRSASVTLRGEHGRTVSIRMDLRFASAGAAYPVSDHPAVRNPVPGQRIDQHRRRGPHPA